MGAPQIIIIVMYCLNLGIVMQNHGKPRKGKDNFFISLFATILNVVILYFGGFWN